MLASTEIWFLVLSFDIIIMKVHDTVIHLGVWLFHKHWCNNVPLLRSVASGRYCWRISLRRDMSRQVYQQYTSGKDQGSLYVVMRTLGRTTRDHSPRPGCWYSAHRLYTRCSVGIGYSTQLPAVERRGSLQQGGFTPLVRNSTTLLRLV